MSLSEDTTPEGEKKRKKKKAAVCAVDLPCSEFIAAEVHEQAERDAELPGTPAGSGQQHRPGHRRDREKGSHSRGEDEEERAEPGRSKSTGLQMAPFIPRYLKTGKD